MSTLYNVNIGMRQDIRETNIWATCWATSRLGDKRLGEILGDTIFFLSVLLSR